MVCSILNHVQMCVGWLYGSRFGTQTFDGMLQAAIAWRDTPSFPEGLNKNKRLDWLDDVSVLVHEYRIVSPWSHRGAGWWPHMLHSHTLICWKLDPFNPLKNYANFSQPQQTWKLMNIHTHVYIYIYYSHIAPINHKPLYMYTYQYIINHYICIRTNIS